MPTGRGVENGETTKAFLFISREGILGKRYLAKIERAGVHRRAWLCLMM